VKPRRPPMHHFSGFQARVVHKAEDKAGNLRCDGCGQLGGIERVWREGVFCDLCEDCKREGVVP